MLSGIIKYSDERNRKYSIKTIVVNNSKESYVAKESVFPEGNEHIKAMYDNQEKLKHYYGNVEICKGTLISDDKITFDFISGESLEEKYVAAVANQDRNGFEKLLQEHKKIIVGIDENECEFSVSKEFEGIFGDGQAYEGRTGLKFSNFDAIPSNIIYDNEIPTFIDYEWIMDFIMPLDLVIYNCIDNLYLKNECIQNFYSEEKALEYLGVEIKLEVLKESYKNFFEYIITDEDGRSYAKDKICCLKPLDTINGIRKEWENCANEWKNAVTIVEEMNSELVELRQNYVNVSDELSSTRTEKDEYMQMYNSIVNSKTWKIATAVKKPVNVLRNKR